MRTIFPTLFCFLLCATPVSAQSPFATARGEIPIATVGGETEFAAVSGKTPAAAGRDKAIDLSLGYSYVSSGQSFSNRIGLMGADASITIGYSRIGIRADLGYARASNVLGTGHRSDVLTYLAGPVFYPMSRRHFDTYIHALAGGAMVSGPVRVNSGGILLGGWATGYSWALGGGVDYWISDSLAIRTGADFLRTAYYDPALAIRGRYNLRTTAAVVYFFGKQSRPWR
jgi:hypothetical protein